MLQRVSDSLPFKGWIILHWMYWPYSAYPSACWETLEWPLPLDCCEWCCHKFGCTNTSVRPGFQFIRMHIPRSRIAGSYGSFNFNFLRSVFHSGCVTFPGFLGQAFRHMLYFSSSMKIDNNLYANFLSCFADVKTPSKWKNYLMTISTKPQASWSPGTAASLSANQNCAQIDHVPCNPLTCPFLLEYSCFTILC